MCSTTVNPQYNPVLKNIHQVTANCLCKLDLQNNYLDEDDSWSGILAYTYFIVRSTYHTKLQSTSSKLVLLLDMIINTPFIADWRSIRRRKQQLIDKNNQNKNKNPTFIE